MSGTKVYIGNLSFETQDAVTCNTSREEASRGFGFVTFEEANCANMAVQDLDNTKLQGRTVWVNLAKEYGGGASYGSLSDRSRCRILLVDI